MASNARAAASIGRGGGNGDGKEPDPKRRRRLDAGGPIEDDEVARQKLRDAKVYERGVDGTWREYVGFDPDNVRDIKSIYADDAGARADHAVKPMGYFAERGDLPMMRWLYVNGADTRDLGLNNFPMFYAAQGNHLDVCKWLFAHGAAEDMKRINGTRGSWGSIIFTVTPLSTAFYRYVDLSRWLILNGALCKDDGSGDLDFLSVKKDFFRDRTHAEEITFWGESGECCARRCVEEREALLQWADDLHRARTSFLLFLSGALPPPQRTGLRQLCDKVQRACRIRRTCCILPLLAGETGVRELIGDYVGFVVGREARIIRQITERLPKVFADYIDDDNIGYISSIDESSNDESIGGQSGSD